MSTAAQEQAARQLFDAVAALIDALYWPGSNTAYVHGDTYLPLQDAYEAMAIAYNWPLLKGFFPLRDDETPAVDS